MPIRLRRQPDSRRRPLLQDGACGERHGPAPSGRSRVRDPRRRSRQRPRRRQRHGLQHQPDVQRAELLMGTCGARPRAWAVLRDQRGSAFLMGLMLVMVMTLLGVALFEMSTIEAGLARSDALDIQAFYCAEAEAARVYGLYKTFYTSSDSSVEAPQPPRDGTTVRLADVPYVVIWSPEGSPPNVTAVNATCTLPDGRTRTVQRRIVPVSYP